MGDTLLPFFILFHCPGEYLNMEAAFKSQKFRVVRHCRRCGGWGLLDGGGVIGIPRAMTSLPTQPGTGSNIIVLGWHTSICPKVCGLTIESLANDSASGGEITSFQGHTIIMPGMPIVPSHLLLPRSWAVVGDKGWGGKSTDPSRDLVVLQKY